MLALGAANFTAIAHKPTGITELDRVLGGGIVPGGVTLLAGEPGIGKSTLVAQIASAMAKTDTPAYYASGEESEGQVLLRFERLGVSPTSIVFSNAVEVGGIVSAARTMTPSIVIVDSIQTMMVEDADAFPGNTDRRACGNERTDCIRKNDEHPRTHYWPSNKRGYGCGAKDARAPCRHTPHTRGRRGNGIPHTSQQQNRFGATDEVGVFEMTEKGMIAVENPSARFLSERVPCPGSVVTCVMEGSRPFLVEIQALVDRSIFQTPSAVRRATTQVDCKCCSPLSAKTRGRQ